MYPSHQRCMDFVLRNFLVCAATSFLVSSGLKRATVPLGSVGFAQPPSVQFGNLRQNCCTDRGHHLLPDTFRSPIRRVKPNSISQTSAILSMGGKGDARSGSHEGFDFIPRRGEMSDATVTHFEFIAECDLPTERQSVQLILFVDQIEANLARNSVGMILLTRCTLPLQG